MQTAVLDGPGSGDERRAALRAAVADRLARADNAAAPRLVLEPEAAAEAGRLTADLRPGDDDPDARLLLARFHGYRFLALRPGGGAQEWSAAIELLAAVFDSARLSELPLPVVADHVFAVAADITILHDLPDSGVDSLTAAVGLWRKILAATPAGHLHSTPRLGTFAFVLAARFEHTGVSADLDEAVDACRRAVQASTAAHPDRAEWLKDSPVDYIDRGIWLNALGNFLRIRSLRTGAPADLDEAVDACRRALQSTFRDDPGRGACLTTLGAALQARFIHTESPMDLYEAIEVARRAVTATPAEDPERAVCLNNLGNALRIRFERTGAPADLDEAVAFGRRAVAAAPAGHRSRAMCLKNLGSALRARFGRDGAAADLDEAVETDRRVVQTFPDDHPDRAMLLHDLAIAFHERFVRTGATAALDEAVDTGRAAVGAAPDTPLDQAVHLDTLASILRARFERAGAPADLDEALASDRRALLISPADAPVRATIMNNLGITLQHLFRQTGTMAQLDEAVEIGRAAVQVTPADDPGLAMRLNNLGSALTLRSDRTGRSADLDEAIELRRRAMQNASVESVEQPIFSIGLGMALRARFNRTGVPTDVHEAVEVSRRAVRDTPAHHPDRAARLTTLGASLHNMARQTGAKAYLDEAVEVSRQAVQAAPAGHPERALCLNNLGNALRLRFDRTGAPADLDEAVAVCRASVEETTEDDPNRMMRLNNLSNALLDRFEWTGARADVDEVVALRRRALQAVPDGDPKLALFLNNLGGALWHRFTRTGAPTDLDEAVAICREAVRATPADHGAMADRLTNLGAMLGSRFERTGTPADLDEAVTLCRQALRITAPDAAERAARLATLGVTLTTRFERTGTIADADEAVTLCRQAVAARPADHPGHTRVLIQLGNALLMRSGHDGAAASVRAAAVPLQDLDEAAAAFYAAAHSPVAQPSLRIQAARAAAGLLWSGGRVRAMMIALSAIGLSSGPIGLHDRRRRAAELLNSAVRLLPEVAPRRLHRPDQQHVLGDYAELAADAAALALRDTSKPAAERAALALQMLETGRAVLLGQALQVRGDTSELESVHPGLAAEFVRLRGLLDHTPAAPASTGTEPTTDTRQRLSRDFDEVLTRIRAQPGFEMFALPPAIGRLLEQAGDGPIVMFNISGYGSDALLLTVSGVQVLSMPGLARDTVIDQVAAFREALAGAGAGATAADRQAAQRRLSSILEWLWDNATGPVLDALGHRRPVPAGVPEPRVWWVPGGLLGRLPIHAAGHHTGPPGRRGAVRTVLDRVVSSYTPSVAALRHARRPTASTDPAIARRALVVAMPTTPGIPGRLHHVPDEAGMLTTRLPGAIILTEPEPEPVAAAPVTSAVATIRSDPAATTTGGADGGLPTLDRVLDLLRECSIVHFACHGVSDAADPSRSRLLLHDHATAPFTVAALAPLDLGHARLAYLSACETAATGTKLVDEAIHLASAFQLAGYPQVIGTLWTVDDEASTEIADSFYAALTPSGGAAPDTSRAAHALHDAVRTMRDIYRATPSLWAAHLHAGA
ncbi:tetratricopeptide repeat protein [Nocardia sp. NPDC001965]